MYPVIVPLMSWPTMTLSIIVSILSVLLAATVLLHKGRGGGMSDLFGGGMSTSMAARPPQSVGSTASRLSWACCGC
ncbi:preprotein translocase subunit SecG [Tessaracoccus coleopterorum]